MPTINIKVKNKIAQQIGRDVYVCGNSDFTVVFSFDAEWDAYNTKIARFKYNGVYQEVVFTGNECPMPIISNANTIQIGVYAGDLRTTTPASVMARKSILCGDGTQYVPPDLYAQLMTTLDDILKRLEAVEKAIENGGGGGGNDDEPDEPDDGGDEGGGGEDDGGGTDDPVVKKLPAPVIRLETVGEPDDGGTGGGTEDDGTYTPAILGVAVLGRTILGRTDGGTVQKLNAPVIRLVTVADGDDSGDEEVKQLTKPTIYIETVDDGGNDEPDEPTPLTQLDKPVIYIDDQTHYHEYTSVTTAPTCTEQGFTTHTCSCGNSYVDGYVDALGHNWSETYYSDEFATGYGRKCNRCGELEAMDAPIVKLDAPVISIETVAVVLDAPEIELVEV